MRRPRSFVLLGLAAPLLLMQLDLSGCIPGAGGTGGGGGAVFNLPPTVIMTADVVRGVAPLVVRFSSAGSTDDGVIVRRLWDFGDGQTSQDISPTHTFQTTGAFTVRLTLTDDQGASASRTIVISVTERPVAIIEVNRTTAPSAPATFDFDGSTSFDPDAKPGDKLSFRWDFGDGARELIPVVAHTFATPGEYRVILTVTDAIGVTGTAEKIIQVGISRPTIAFRSPPAAVPNVVCSTSSPLWVNAVFDVTPGVPYTIRVGLDGDRDTCDALTALFDAQTGAELQRLTGHSAPVRTAAFSPDGVYVLSAGEDATARLYETQSGDFIRAYTGNLNPISGVAFAPDGSRLVIASTDGTVTLRDTFSNQVVRTFVGHAAGVNGVAFSPTGSRILTGDSDGVAILWSASTGGELMRFNHSRGVTSVAFSPTDSARVLTGSVDQTARLWSTTNGQLVRAFGPVFINGELAAGHSNSISSVAFSPDGAEILTGSDDSTAKLWDVTTGSELRTFRGHSDRVASVAFAPDGKRIITGSADGTARIWDVATGNLVRTLTPCASPISAVAFSPDGATVLAAVAAKNDIRLDTNPPQGNDIDLTLPTALDLSHVPSGSGGREYFLWAEVDTDRSEPSRTYADTVVNVVPPFTVGIDSFTPRVPFQDGQAAIVTPVNSRRQVVDLGAVAAGDRLFLSLLTTPGYGVSFSQDGFSVLILDAQQKLYGWYQDGRVLFSRDAKLLIGHNSTSYYLVLDGANGQLTPGVNVRIERGAAADSQPRQQVVYLNFTGAASISAAGSALFGIGAFAPAGFGAAAVQAAAVARVNALFAGHDVVITTTAPADPVQPVKTIYFDTSGGMFVNGGLTAGDLVFFGIPNYLDPRNDTLTGQAVISVTEVLDAFPGLATDAELGTTLGNIVAHQIGFMSGLRETTGNDNDVMTSASGRATADTLTFTTANLAASEDMAAIGVQDASLLLQELFGD
jgi:WD40 repeat protein